ncbi:MAG: hypothetical protein ABSC23_02555 [Bryobacteraceae bacterium]
MPFFDNKLQYQSLGADVPGGFAQPKQNEQRWMIVKDVYPPADLSDQDLGVRMNIPPEMRRSRGGAFGPSEGALVSSGGVMASAFPRRWCPDRVWLVASLLVGAAAAFVSRYAINSDGISYLDIAGRVAHGNFTALLNAYWSPLYPALISVLLRLPFVGPPNEVQAIHALGFGIYVVGLLGTRALIRAICDHFAIPSGTLKTAFAAASYCAYQYAALFLIGLNQTNPDLLVCALTIWVYALGVPAFRDPRISRMVGLAMLVALQFFAKPPAVLTGGLLLALMTTAKPVRRRPLLPVLLAGALVFVAMAPFVALISRRAGHLSFGESARLNYAWCVLHTPGGVWSGVRGFDPSAEFRTQIVAWKRPAPGVTYDIWYEPSRWHKDSGPRFDLGKQVAAVGRGMRVYGGIFANGPVLAFLGLIVAAFLLSGRRLGTALSTITQEWRLFLPALAPFGMYALVVVDSRYVASYVFLVLVLSLAGAITLSRCARVLGVAVNAAAAALLCVNAGGILKSAGPSAAVFNSLFNSNAALACRLAALGAGPGGAFASVLVGLPPDNIDGPGVLWARLARSSVTAHVVVPAGALGEQPPVAALSALRKGGIGWLVATERGALRIPAVRWEKVSGSSLYLAKVPTVQNGAE